MNHNEKLIEEAVTQALSESDDRNHEDLCHCGSWPATCVTYGDRKPWSHDAESVARAAALAVIEKDHTPTDDDRTHEFANMAAIMGIPEPQGEPSDAQAERFGRYLFEQFGSGLVRASEWTEKGRAALRVAFHQDESSDTQEEEHPCGDYPAPCNCDDPSTHDRSLG